MKRTPTLVLCILFQLLYGQTPTTVSVLTKRINFQLLPDPHQDLNLDPHQDLSLKFRSPPGLKFKECIPTFQSSFKRRGCKVAMSGASLSAVSPTILPKDSASSEPGAAVEAVTAFQTIGNPRAPRAERLLKLSGARRHEDRAASKDTIG